METREYFGLADDSMFELDACAQAELVRTGRISALELVDRSIACIERLNPALNAIASRDDAAARERAGKLPTSGPFAGVPTLLKDTLAYPGMRHEFGSLAFAGNIAQAGSDYTDALDAAGLIILGKSTTSELGLLGTTETLACGASRNPWNLAHSTGGSSGGAVAAVASGMVAIAHASDGGGSIRGPASFCGVFGFKPSRGRHRSVGAAQATPFGMLVSDHCVSRSVRDSATWLAATERTDQAAPHHPVGLVSRPGSRRLRVGVYLRDGFGASPTPEVADALARSAALCASLGHHVEECTGPVYDAQAASDAFFLVAGATMAGLFAYLRSLDPHFSMERFEPYTRALVEHYGGRANDAGDLPMDRLRTAAHGAQACFEDYDVLLCPTVGFTAPPLGTVGPASSLEEGIRSTRRIAAYTAIASIAGWCAMSVPLYQSPSGMPIGIHFAAAPGADATLLELAFELEQALPWRHRRPARADAYGATA